jgi:hypothetical protein
VNRFFGLPATIEALYAWDDNSLESQLGRMMTWSMMIYFPTEHIWYLSSLKPTIITGIDANWWSQLSCRAWAVYVILDIVGTLRKIMDLQSKIQSESSQKKSDLSLLLKRYSIWLSVCLFGDLPLALQWSVSFLFSLSKSMMYFTSNKTS